VAEQCAVEVDVETAQRHGAQRYTRAAALR
jgi:hypothetical protein